MLLHHCTWPEVEAYLTRSRGIIIPIGSTEQHGPTGAIGTDAICAEAIARGVGEATDALVTPTISVGMALHHLAFAGSMSLRPETLMAVVQDWVTSLARHGFERFFFINGHGGNMATLKAAFAQTYQAIADLGTVPGGDRVRCRLANWYMTRGAYQLAKELYGDAEGSHATPSEIAVTLFVHPPLKREVPLEPAIAPSGRAIYGAAAFRQAYPDGRMGSNPSLATADHGQQFYGAAVRELSESYRAFLTEP